MAIIKGYDHPDTQKFLQWFDRQNMETVHHNITCPACHQANNWVLHHPTLNLNACYRCWYIRYHYEEIA